MPRELGTLKPQMEEVTIDGVLYVITEASAASEVEYRNANSAAVRYDNTGKRVSMERLHDGEPILAGMNIYEWDRSKKDFRFKDGDGDPIPVGVPIVKIWPAPLMAEVYETVKRMSPTLNGQYERSRMTVKELDAEIKRLTEARDRLKKSAEGEDRESPTPGTTGTSVSQTASGSPSTS